jgi:hypothetical protein
MFKQLSIETRDFLKELPDFTNVMQRPVDGVDKLFLFPIVAGIENKLPLTTYVLGERMPETKDNGQLVITLNFWFDVESYDECCDFTDKIADAIDDSYLLQSSSIEYNEESGTFSGIINFIII